MIYESIWNGCRDKMSFIAKKFFILVISALILLLLTAGTAFAAAPTFSGQAPYATINGLSIFGREMAQSDRVMVTIQDTDRDIVPSSIVMNIDGQIITPSLISPIFNGYFVNFTPMIPWADNSYHTVTVSCTDAAGSFASTSWSFIKVSPPVVSNILPDRMSDTLNDTNSVDISFHINDNSDGIDPASIQIQIDNGSWVTPNVVMSNNNKDADVTYKAANLTEGQHEFKVKATDTHGTSIPPIYSNGSSAGWQFSWHYEGGFPPGYVFGVPIDMTAETYYNPSGNFEFFLSAFDTNGFSDAYKPSMMVNYPNKTYPLQATGGRITFNPVSYVFNNNYATISALLPIGGSVPDGPGYVITYSSTNPRPIGYEGLYTFQPNFRNSKGQLVVNNITPFPIKLITGYPNASEVYPNPGTMVIQPTAPQVSVRMTDPGAGASGPLFDTTMKMTENGTTISTSKTNTGIAPDYRMTTLTAPGQGFHSITASFNDRALNPGSAQIDYYYKTITGTGPAFTSIYPMDYSAPNVAANGYGLLTPDAQGNVSIIVKVKDTNLISQSDTMAIYTEGGAVVPFTRTFNYGTDQSEATITYTFKPPVETGVYNFNLTVKDQTNVASTLTNYQFKIKSDLPQFTDYAPGTQTLNNQPTFSVKVTDFSGINQDSIIMNVDGLPVTPTSIVPCTNGYIVFYTPSVPYIAGTTHTAFVMAQDNAGNPIQTSNTWSTTVVTLPDIVEPANGSTVTNDDNSAEVSSQVTGDITSILANSTNVPAQMSVTGSANVGLCQTCHTKGDTAARDFKKIHFLDMPYLDRHEQRCWRCHDDLQLTYPDGSPRSKCSICHGDISKEFYNPPGGTYWWDNNSDWDYNHGFSSQWSYLDRGDASKYALNAPREGLDCVYCHQNPKTAAGDTPAASHDLDAAHISDFGGEGCSSCHSDILTREHGKSTSVDKDHNNSPINCNTCHNSTRTDVKAAIKNYTQLGSWNFTGDVLGSLNLPAPPVYSSPEYFIPGKKLTRGTLAISVNDQSYWTLKAYYNGTWHTVYSVHLTTNQSSYQLIQQNPWWEGTVAWVTGDGSTNYERTQPQSGMSEWKNIEIIFPQPAEKIKYEFTSDGQTTRERFRSIAKFTNYEAGLTPKDPTVTCTSCHSQSNHQAVHTGSLDSNCQTCHKKALDQEHLDNTTTAGKNYSCNTCHANTGKTVNRTIAANSLYCAGCHSTGHNVIFADQVPADIPLYEGFNWSTPMEASIFAGESTLPAGYDNGQVIVSDRRTDVTVNQAWNFYNQQLTAGQWVLISGVMVTDAFFSAEYTKEGRAVTVKFFNTEFSNGLGQTAASGYRIELWYK